jgi:hypothetical protein
MKEFKTIAELTSRLRRSATAWLTSLCAVLILSACAMHANDLVPDQDKVGVTVTAIGHYGAMIGIPEYSVDGFHAGNNSGWGGGGSFSCCVLLPRVVTKPMVVTVRWETYRSNVDEERHHKATVPIHFAVEPGDSSGLYVHFLPGHKVEVWVSWLGPGHPQYPGPKRASGPPPSYAPLPDEKPAPSTGSSSTTH